VIESRCHFASSGQVFVCSCFSVFAVTTTFVSRRVSSAHLISIMISADFPMPWPEHVASRMTSSKFVRAPARSLAPIRSSAFRCQARGPGCRSSSVFFTPHGKL
jgi:hypothetical protein